MRKVKTFSQAMDAAEKYFKETFNHSGKMGFSKHEIKKDGSELLEFYSKDDPKIDTFKVIIEA